MFYFKGKSAWGFISGTSAHADRIATIQSVYKESKRIIDPHTADGVHVARELKSDIPVICLATALPVKFEDTIHEALGFVPERPERFRNLRDGVGNTGFGVLNTDGEALKDFLRSRMSA